MKTFNLHMMPPIAYEIKHGGKNDRNLPMKFDGMVVVERNRDGKGNSSRFVMADSIMQKLHEFNGTEAAKADQPVKRIPIRFLSDDIGENFNMYRAFFLRSTIACGSGANESSKTAMRRFTKENGVTEFVEPYEVPCDKDCPIWNSDNAKFSCDIYGSLHFVLADNIHPSGSFCVHRINGRNAQRRIMSSLYMLSKYTNGILANIPLCIAFHFENVPDHTGQLQKVPVMAIEPEGGYEKLRLDIIAEMDKRKQLGITRYENILDLVVERSLVTEIEETSSWIGRVNEEEEDNVELFSEKNEGASMDDLAFLLSTEVYERLMQIPMGMRKIITKRCMMADGDISEKLLVAELDKVRRETKR